MGFGGFDEEALGGFAVNSSNWRNKDLWAVVIEGSAATGIAVGWFELDATGSASGVAIFEIKSEAERFAQYLCSNGLNAKVVAVEVREREEGAQ